MFNDCVDFNYVRMQTIHEPTKSKNEICRTHTNEGHTISIQHGILNKSWWWCFKDRHLKMNIQQAKGLKLYKAQGLTSNSYNSFYTNL